MTVYTGEIRGLTGSWGSGIGVLLVGDKQIPCENAPTVRALNAMFGDVIQPGHIADLRHVVGQEVVAVVSSYGLLAELYHPEDWEDQEALESDTVG